MMMALSLSTLHHVKKWLLYCVTLIGEGERGGEGGREGGGKRVYYIHSVLLEVVCSVAKQCCLKYHLYRQMIMTG